jgi:ESF2/ABP1 family protein
MATRKRNEFLDIDESDGEVSDQGYDSEAAEEAKGRTAKRRKVLEDNHDFTDSEDERHDHDAGVLVNEDQDDEDELGHIANDHVERCATSSPSKTKANQKPIKPLDKQPEKNKTGVVYLSSLPPYLKPFALKTLLLQRGFGPITKIFLTPAALSSGGSGKRSNRRKTYTDGWVEFESKKTAKICAETLNANIVGGRKGGWYHDDVWNMKYLRGFKWADLMEQVQRERSEREARRRVEDARSRKEDKIFLSGVEKGKVVEGIRKKREEKKAKVATNEAAAADVPELQVRRVFKQNEVRAKGESKDFSALDEDARRVLGKIF